MSGPIPTPSPAPKKGFVLPGWINLAAAGLALVVSLFGIFVRPSPGPAPMPALPITLPETVQATPGQLVAIPAKLSGAHVSSTVKWYAHDAAVQFVAASRLKDTKTAVVQAPWTPGKYLIHAHAAQAGEPVERASCTLIVAGPVPPGPGPVPPVPPVPPIPPQPPAPIQAAGFRTLIVYESADLGKLSKEQADVLASAELRTYLNAKCATGADGKTHEWRILDKDVPMKDESALWQAAMKLPRTSLPWIVISTGTTGFSGPLPGTIADTMTLVKKFGG